jgi:hypothetical protein
MQQRLRSIWAGLLLTLSSGCLGSRPFEFQAVPETQPACEIENPVYIPLGHESYGLVFESVLQTLIDQGFEIQEANRYDGRVEALPRTAPGLGLWMKPGSPSFRERLLSTLQSYRHRVSVVIQPADNGGYFVEIIARKELEDLARPTRSTAGAAFFRNETTVERQFEVIDATVVDSAWIYKGRDPALEQRLIERLKGAI